MIEGRVAQILSDRELVINRGQEDGVEFGMEFKVLSDLSIEITDPETGASLGSIDRPKVQVRAVEVHEKFAVCKTVMFTSDGSELRELDFFRPRSRVADTLRGSVVTPPLAPHESIVRVGDRVKQTPQRRMVRSGARTG